MIGNWELNGLSTAEQHYTLADAYAEAAYFLACGLRDGSYPKTFSHAKVILSLHHHSVELFFKYALKRANKPFPTNHYLRELQELYTAAYPDTKYCFQSSFVSELSGLPEKDITDVLDDEKEDKNKMDQSLRYHTDREEKPWPMIQGIIPEHYPEEIAELRDKFHLLHSIIEQG